MTVRCANCVSFTPIKGKRLGKCEKYGDHFDENAWCEHYARSIRSEPKNSVSSRRNYYHNSTA